MGTYRYPAEFRADAVALVRSSGRPIAQVAKELGGNHETLRHWVRTTERAERPEAVAESAKDAELARLRKEVAELRGLFVREYPFVGWWIGEGLVAVR